MKRSKALRALSHQHNQGLFAALQLKRAGREAAVEARQAFLDFYEREGSRRPQPPGKNSPNVIRLT